MSIMIENIAPNPLVAPIIQFVPFEKPRPFVIPSRLVMRYTICEYCGNESAFAFRVLNHLHGILTCDSELCKNNAKRDVHAFFHTEKYARMGDIIKMFPDMNLQSIAVMRRDGSITPGGKILEGTIDLPCFLRKLENNWCIPVTFTQDGNNSAKCMPIKYLIHSGLSESFIDNLIKTLDAGIYKNEYDAFMEACRT